MLQSYSNQNSMVLAQTHTWRSMKQNREPRNKPSTYGQSVMDKARMYSGEKSDSSVNGIGTIGQLHVTMKLYSFLKSCEK